MPAAPASCPQAFDSSRSRLLSTSGGGAGGDWRGGRGCGRHHGLQGRRQRQRCHSDCCCCARSAASAGAQPTQPAAKSGASAAPSSHAGASASAAARTHAASSAGLGAARCCGAVQVCPCRTLLLHCAGPACAWAPASALLPNRCLPCTLPLPSSDDFDGGALDAAKWGTESGQPKGTQDAGQLQTYTTAPANLAVKGGNLEITALQVGGWVGGWRRAGGSGGGGAGGCRRLLPSVAGPCNPATPLLCRLPLAGGWRLHVQPRQEQERLVPWHAGV